MQKINELFIPYEIALKLKEKGFDEAVLAHYIIYKEGNREQWNGGNKEGKNEDLVFHGNDWGEEENIESLCYSVNSIEETGYYCYKEYIAASLYQQVIDWFREKHNIHINIMNQAGHFELIFSKTNENNWLHELQEIERISFINYYDCLQKGIETVLNLI